MPWQERSVKSQRQGFVAFAAQEARAAAPGRRRLRGREWCDGFPAVIGEVDSTPRLCASSMSSWPSG